MPLATYRIAVTALLLGGAPLQQVRAAQVEGTPLLEERFEEGWDERWQEQKLAWRKTQFRVVEQDEDPVLRADSQRAAAGLWRAVTLDAPASGSISWRWKVERPVQRSGREREKRGDDYAARVFVVFGGAFADPDTRAVCYVWAKDLTVGSTFPSPYTENVAMIVVESGDSLVGEWVRVERDFVSDYREFFGEPPATVSAVAVMVDTDNTWSEARTFFDDIVLVAR
jgi:hypothetical protein